jgi:rubredoxin
VILAFVESFPSIFSCQATGGNAMKKIWDTMNRRQFIKRSTLIFWGLFSFILLGFPQKVKAQSEKDINDQSEYICEICGYIYDPAKGDPSEGIPAGKSFKELPDSWRCPLCGVDKTMFKKWS